MVFKQHFGVSSERAKLSQKNNGTPILFNPFIYLFLNSITKLPPSFLLPVFFAFFQHAGHQSFPVAAGSASAYTIAVADLVMHKNIDPVVMRGQYKSHMHSLFGSDAVTINTTSSAGLQAGCTTAHNANDFSSYCNLSPTFVPRASSYLAGGSRLLIEK